jgi:hypothetical protein
MTSRKNTVAAPLLAWARFHGCDVEYAKGHYKVTYRGRLVGTCSSTPSDHRSAKNSRSFLKRRLAQVKAQLKEAK